MELYLEFLLTAVISVLIVFLIGKIAGAGDPTRNSEEGVALTADLGHGEGEIGGGVGGAVLAEEERERSMEVKMESGVRGDSANAAVKNDEVIESRTIKVVAEIGVLEGERVEGSEEVRSREEVMFLDDSGKEVQGGVKIDRIHEDLVKDQRFDREEALEGHGLEGESRRGGAEEEMSFLHGEDEWEGIERSEVAKLFGVATAYVRSEKGAEALSKLSSDVQMQLYALHKVATEGPCHESQPLALKISTRAKWYC